MQVKLYGLSTCPYCRMTKKYLLSNDVEFESIEVDKLEGKEREDTIATVKEISGGASFPVVVLGDEVIVGFNKMRIKELLNL